MTELQATQTQRPGKGRNQGLPNPGETLPEVAWPTIGLFFGAFAVLLVSVVGYFAGTLPAAVVVALNAVVSFVMFTVLHDASHHTIGRSDALNDIFGRLSMLFVVTYGSFSFFRYLHIEHHRNTNEGDGHDPDLWCSEGPAWQHPLRWASIDLHYAVFWLSRIRQRPLDEVLETVGLAAVTFAILGWAISAGYAMEAAVLYLIPQRIALTVLAWWFDYLPHHGLEDTARENRFQATRNRVGMEWLLTPLMLSQNYHLVHHLHPSIPFYAYIRAWRRNETAYMARGAAVSTVWGREMDTEEYLQWRDLPPLQDADEQAQADASTRAQFHELTVDKVERLTPNSVAVTFALPSALRETFRYTQGQHITLRCPQCGEGEVRRNYSICAPVSAETLRIGVRHIPGGAFSTYAMEQLQAGDTLEVMPPSGRFYTPLDARHAKYYVAIAVGSGITPILSILQTTLEVEQESKFVLLFGNRDVDSIMFRDEIQALKDRYPERFQVLHFLSQPNPEDPDMNGSLQREEFHGRFDRELLAGRIDRDKVERLMDSFMSTQEVDEWFLCGPQGLVEDVEALLHERDVDDHYIHHELFIAAPKRKPGATVPAEDAAMSAVTITAGGETAELEVAQAGETVLDAGMRERDDLPYSCLGGACGTCRAKLCEGTVEMEQNFALDADELDAGYVLTCQSRPTSDKVVLDYDG